MNPDLAAVFLIAVSGDEFALTQALHGGGHGAAGEAHFGGELIDGLGAFFEDALENV